MVIDNPLKTKVGIATHRPGDANPIFVWPGYMGYRPYLKTWVTPAASGTACNPCIRAIQRLDWRPQGDALLFPPWFSMGYRGQYSDNRGTCSRFHRPPRFSKRCREVDPKAGNPLGPGIKALGGLFWGFSRPSARAEPLPKADRTGRNGVIQTHRCNRRQGSPKVRFGPPPPPPPLGVATPHTQTVMPIRWT